MTARPDLLWPQRLASRPPLRHRLERVRRSRRAPGSTAAALRGCIGRAAAGFFYDGAGTSQPFVDAGQPLSSDVRYTYTYDVPWDWTHRYPPNVVPSNRPYVPSCPTEQVTVPGRGGSEHTVNIMRCY
ncbi:hypothetical protein ABIA41_007004 [Bradyrhizobium sp. USDA 313]